MKKLDTTPKLFSREDAEKTAKELQSGGDDWTYTPVHCPKGTGLSYIEVCDENGVFVAKW